MKLEISYPFKPYTITQHWGNPNPSYEQFGFSQHNGTDAITGFANAHQVYAPKTWPVYCPVEGFTVYRVSYNPKGGGHEIWLLSDQRLQMGDKTCYALMVLCHGDKILVPAGYQPAKGELIMIGDNTGFSTGAHTHMGLYRVEYDGIRFTYLDQNDANGSHNLELYFTNRYAVDEATAGVLTKSVFRYWAYVIGG